MSLEQPNEQQRKLLESIEFPSQEWARDIIWLKRLDAVANKELQQKANKLFKHIISKYQLFTRVEKRFKLISAEDNVWDSQRQI